MHWSLDFDVRSKMAYIFRSQILKKMRRDSEKEKSRGTNQGWSFIEKKYAFQRHKNNYSFFLENFLMRINLSLQILFSERTHLHLVRYHFYGLHCGFSWYLTCWLVEIGSGNEVTPIAKIWINHKFVWYILKGSFGWCGLVLA